LGRVLKINRLPPLSYGRNGENFRMQNASEVKQQIIMLKQLPPLSATAARLLETLNNENASLSGLSEIISQDPGITARILGVANSAYFGQTNPILSVEEAIIRVLGLNMVKSLAFSIAISGVFDAKRCAGFDLEKYWFSSLATAALAREICRKLRPGQLAEHDAVYLAGLLFDIGTLVLVHLFPEDYGQVIRQLAGAEDVDRLQVEEGVLGINSQQAGAWLTDRWHLPPVVVRVVAQSQQEETSCEVGAVTLAAQLIRTLGPTETEMPPISEILQGLTNDKLTHIYQACRQSDEELHAIASVMVR
jgi:HD-like signal output (HDOD) protein